MRDVIAGSKVSAAEADRVPASSSRIEHCSAGSGVRSSVVFAAATVLRVEKLSLSTRTSRFVA
jgi:hypothetical protein